MRYICVHGHFYQPPRENPWLEAIEPQDSAAPYHDWNARVSAECYAPNTAARILDRDNQIVSIVNNYGRISFDFGPTLLSWLEQKQPSVYGAILRADRKSHERFSGHGSAMAQAYNHTILPLATSASKRLQVVWGVRDFEHRFGRKPEGMWLPETAVDLESLEYLAESGIRFTVLAPSQAHRVRPKGAQNWEDVSGTRIDTTRPYEQRLPSGKTIAIFFYDGVLSRGVAFEGLLHRGEAFAARLVEAAPDEPRTPGDETRLAHIATDGESYGHHHPHGDMALAFALDAIGNRDGVTLTNYGEFLERFPPTSEVEIFERSSWSCAHGVERWRSDCGCHTGGPLGWNQRWRGPLRNALDWLYDRASSLYSERAQEAFRDPQQTLDDYVDVVNDRDPSRVASFLKQHLAAPVGTDEGVHELKLLELRRQIELMYTSCGWFFNDLSGLETVQILRYAGRAVQLTEDLSGMSVERPFLEKLDEAMSNRFDRGSGREIYERSVQPAKITWEMLTAHYAIDTFFETGPASASLYCHDVVGERGEIATLKNGRIASGTAHMTSRITRSKEALHFVVLHPGGPRVLVGVHRGTTGAEALVDAIVQGDGANAAKMLRGHFGRHVYTLDSLFGDERRRIVETLLSSTLAEAEASHVRVAKKHGPTIRFLVELGVPIPPALSAASEIVANANLRRAFTEEPLDPDRISLLLDEAAGSGVQLDTPELSFLLEHAIHESAQAFFSGERNLEELQRLDRSVALARRVPFEVELWKIQNLYLRARRDLDLVRGASDDWMTAFRSLGARLSIRTPGP